MSALADRYALALLDAAEAAESALEVGEQLDLLVSLWQRQPGLRTYLLDRSIPAAAKLDLIKRAYASQLHPYAANFLAIVFDKGREKELPAMVRAYYAHLLRRHRIAEVRLTTVVQPTPAQTERLTLALSQALRQEVLLQQEVDPELLGGAIIQVGDRVYDGSLRHSLSQLRRSLELQRSEVRNQKRVVSSE